MVPVNEIMIQWATHQVAVQTDELLGSNYKDRSQKWQYKFTVCLVKCITVYLYYLITDLLLKACLFLKLNTGTYSYSRYSTGTSLQVRLMREIFSNANDIYLFLMTIPRISLHCKLVPVQYRGNEYGLVMMHKVMEESSLVNLTKTSLAFSAGNHMKCTLWKWQRVAIEKSAPTQKIVKRSLSSLKGKLG